MNPLKELSGGEEYWLGGYYLGDPHYTDYVWTDGSDWEVDRLVFTDQHYYYRIRHREIGVDFCDVTMSLSKLV